MTKVHRMNENGRFVRVCPVSLFQSSWKCQLVFCESRVNNAQCCVSQPPLGSFYSSFLLEEDMSL